MKDESQFGYDQVLNPRNLPPGFYNLLIIGSFGEVSESQTITFAQKLIPHHQTVSDQ